MNAFVVCVCVCVCVSNCVRASVCVCVCFFFNVRARCGGSAQVNPVDPFSHLNRSISGFSLERRSVLWPCYMDFPSFI